MSAVRAAPLTTAYPLTWPAGWPRVEPRLRKSSAFRTGYMPAFESLMRELSLLPAGWPRVEPRLRKSSAFRTGYMPAFENLMIELSLLGASAIVVASNAPLRKDGRPYTDAMTGYLDDPGVAVWFRLSNEPRVMARDGHPTPAENLHAIGHVIGHLRGLNRHGGSYMMNRAFSGFTALTPPISPWETLGLKPGASPDEIARAYREKAKAAHPDYGGSHDAMAALNRARDQALGG